MRAATLHVRYILTHLLQFQSTLPMRAATVKNRLAVNTLITISIHAAHAGSDTAVTVYENRSDISIHAAHAGSDIYLYA